MSLNRALDLIIGQYSKRVSTIARPLVVGLQGIQGSGKSTLCRNIVIALADRGIHALSISIDDFYRTHAELNAIFENSGRNWFWRYRGLPGSHDLLLAARVLRGLTNCSFPVSIPIYDKSLYSGEGDRSTSCVEIVERSYDIVLVEGWCLGFASLGTYRVRDMHSKDPFLQKFDIEQLLTIDRNLEGYHQLNGFMDVMIALVADDMNLAYVWRLEQEENLRLMHGPSAGLSPDKVREFVDRFMVCYHLYQDVFIESMPSDFCIHIDKNREICL
eukprot:Partr_v1_DN27388_c1_g1_i2_m46431 putative D-glycerate 3-kinase